MCWPITRWKPVPTTRVTLTRCGGLVLSLRGGMGITVDELCALAAQRPPQDVLLFGNCEVVQHRPLRVGGATIEVTATIEPVSRKETGTVVTWTS